MTSCSFVDRYWRFGGTCCLYLHSALNVEVALASETFVCLYQTTEVCSVFATEIFSNRSVVTVLRICSFTRTDWLWDSSSALSIVLLLFGLFSRLPLFASILPIINHRIRIMQRNVELSKNVRIRHWEVSIWTQNAAHYGIKMDGLSFVRHCTHIVSLLIDTGSKYVIIHGIHEEVNVFLMIFLCCFPYLANTSVNRFVVRKTLLLSLLNISFIHFEPNTNIHKASFKQHACKHRSSVAYILQLTTIGNTTAVVMSASNVRVTLGHVIKDRKCFVVVEIRRILTKYLFYRVPEYCCLIVYKACLPASTSRDSFRTVGHDLRDIFISTY